MADAVADGRKIRCIRGGFLMWMVRRPALVLSHFFRMIGTETDIHIPDRMNEGILARIPLLGAPGTGMCIGHFM